MTVSFFPDISFWQGEPNFDVMRQATDYVIFKSSQRNYADPQFTRNRSEALRVGLAWGIYHFYDGRSSPKVQADTIANLLRGHPPPAEIWMDWERNYNGAWEGLRNVVACMEEVERLTGIVMGMYTGYYWFVGNSNKFTHASQYNYLGQRPLWLAWYTDDHTPKNFERVRVPPPWTKIDIWQYGTPVIAYQFGVDTRVSKEIDMNMRVGDSIGIPPTEPLPPPARRVSVINLTIRSNTK